MRTIKATRIALPAAVSVTGGLLIALVAAAGHLPAEDAVTLVAYAAGGAAVAGAVSAGLLGVLRGSSVVAQAAVAGLAPVLAVAIGVAGASSAMFISGHDLHALWLILPPAPSAC